jgi:hypothetical protein
MSEIVTENFTVDDFRSLTSIVDHALRAGVDRNWSVPAGTLDWSCWTTLDHTVDCVFSYALFLASRRQTAYPRLGELHAPPEATPADLVENLGAATTMLEAVIRAAPPATRAILRRYPEVTLGTPDDFAARGGLEMILHTHDICRGLDVVFDPPDDLCQRLRDHTDPWPGHAQGQATSDPWLDLLERSGRAY